MTLLSWKDLAAQPVRPPRFYIEPYIVESGTTLMFGRWSTAKSPVSWHMASAIGTGQPFFGMPVRQGKVLYIDVDTPEAVLYDRLRPIQAANNVWFWTHKALFIPDVPEETRLELQSLQDTLRPDVVFLNTLRRLHSMDDKDSRAPTTVYSYFQYLFPQAALVFVHHARKASRDPRAEEHEEESFSGSQHWVNDAQVSLQMRRYTARNKLGELITNYRLVHHKSQVSRTISPMPLLLGKDGASLRCHEAEELETARQLMLSQPSLRGAKFDEELAQKIACGLTTARARRLTVEDGLFPGVGWLEKPDEEEEPA